MEGSQGYNGLTDTFEDLTEAGVIDPALVEISALQNAASISGLLVTPLRAPDSHEIILEGLDAVSKPVLFWRSFIQWFGGLGIIFLFIAIFPALSIGGKFLYEAEITGPFKEALTPRIKETASYLWKIYLGLTLLEILCLRVFNHDMPLFDAITVTFSNISTGGKAFL